MKPLTPPRREATAQGGNAQPTSPLPAPMPPRPVLLRQSSPQQLALDLRRR